MNELSYESDFTPQDLKKAMTFNSYFKFRWTIPMLIGLAVVGILGIIWNHDLSITSAIFVLAILYPIYYVISAQKSISQGIKNKKNPGNVRQRIILTEDYLVCSRNGKLDRYEWNEVSSASESKECFYIYMNEGRVLVLPKRDVSSETALSTRSLLRGSLPSHRAHMRKDVI